MDWGQFGGIATFAGVLVALGIYLHSHWTRTIEAQVADASYRERLIARHECKSAAGYYLSLTRLLGWVEGVYGPKLGWRAFNISLTLAFIYPLLAALIGWQIANQNSPGGLQLFRQETEWIERLWRSGALLTAIICAAWIFSRAGRWSKKLHGFFETRIAPSTSQLHFIFNASWWFPMVSYLFAAFGSIVFAVALVRFVASALEVLDAFALAGAGAFGLAIAGAVVYAVAVFGAITVTATAAGAVVVAFASEPDQVAVVVFLYLLLPLANALADWLSLAITRALLADMAQRRPGAWGLAAHLFIDLIAGAICLALLLAGLVGLLDLWATIHPAGLPFDWRAYWLAARADPWQGLALWLMVFTTMVPTLVHAAYSLTLWQAQKSEHTRAAVALMRGMSGRVSNAARNEAASLILRGTLVGAFRASVIWGVPLALILWLAWQWLATA